MPNACKRVVVCLNLAFLGILVGCNGGDATQTPAAAVNAKGDSSANAKTAETSPGKAAFDPQHPVVVFDTSLGKITLRLNGEKAPQTVDNFLSYVNSHHYDATIVHQVYKGQGILAGGYGTNLLEKPTRTKIRNEADNGLKNLRGTISMVRQPDDIDSATCQFFINVADNTALDYKDRTPEGYGYCVFGEVTEGMDVVDNMANSPVQDTTQFERTPAQQIIIKSAQRIR